MFLYAKFSASFGFHCCDFYADLFSLSVSLPFSGTPIYFSCFLFFLFNFPFLCFVPFLKSCLFCFFFMDHSGIRCTSPLVTFFFACLGAFIGCSSGLYRLIRDFTLGDNGLSLVLGELYPLLCKSLSWFESVRGVLGREKMSSEGRFDDLRAILSSNAGVGEVKTDTTISKPPSSRPSVPTSPRPFHSF